MRRPPRRRRLRGRRPRRGRNVQRGKSSSTSLLFLPRQRWTGWSGSEDRAQSGVVHGRADVREKTDRWDAALYRQTAAGCRPGRYLRVPPERSRRAAVEEHSAPEPIASRDPGRGHPRPGSRYNKSDVPRKMSRLPALILAGFACAIALPRPALDAAAPQTSKKTDLPSLSYVCPMVQDAEIVEDQAGKCRKCGMVLVPVRLQSAWSCPHPPGHHRIQSWQVPIDRARSHCRSWRRCSGLARRVPSSIFSSPAPARMEAPACRNSSAGPAEITIPRHGEILAADDNWHHLEGTAMPTRVPRLSTTATSQPISPKGISPSRHHR